MMHYNDLIVALCDEKRKTFREYDSQRNNNGRKCKVHIPFDSEYQFYVKNNSSNRTRLDIFIDGSLVTNNGLIISGNTSDHIERFLNSDKKFKFVRASNETVSDPTSPENGIIKVIAHREKPTAIISWIPPIRYVPRWVPYPDPHLPQKRYAVTPLYGSYDGPICCDNIGNISTHSMSNPTSTTYSASVGGTVEPGATVEGDFSNQTFGSTDWNGDDGDPTIFSFYVVGTEPLTDPIREQKLKEYHQLKQELRL